jgi:hypothetical protein
VCELQKAVEPGSRTSRVAKSFWGKEISDVEASPLPHMKFMLRRAPPASVSILINMFINSSDAGISNQLGQAEWWTLRRRQAVRSARPRASRGRSVPSEPARARRARVHVTQEDRARPQFEHRSHPVPLHLFEGFISERGRRGDYFQTSNVPPNVEALKTAFVRLCPVIAGQIDVDAWSVMITRRRTNRAYTLWKDETDLIHAELTGARKSCPTASTRCPAPSAFPPPARCICTRG